MTSLKASDLKNQMVSEFNEIFSLCNNVLMMASAQQKGLVSATLDTLLKFLHWIPYGYIFESQIVDIIAQKYFNTKEFRNVSLRCFTEIASLKAD